jgi:hypothetical protein
MSHLLSSDPLLEAVVPSVPAKFIHKIRSEDNGVYYGIARNSPKWETLSPAWVVANFSKPFLEKLCSTAGVPMIVPKTDCVSNLSRGMRHAGFPDKADALEKMAESIHLCDMNQAAQAVSRVANMGGFAVRRLSNHDPLTDKSPWPTQIQLCDTGGNNTRVVCTVGDLLFCSDSNEAVPLSPETLNMACEGGFDHCSNAWRLIPGKKLLKRKRSSEA